LFFFMTLGVAREVQRSSASRRDEKDDSSNESFQTARIYLADDMKYERIACCRHLKVPFLHQVRQLLVTYIGGIRHLQSLEGI
jgi:hypothetical protein